MTNASSNSPDDADGAIPSFTPVDVRARHDGWSPERQIEFIEALAECGCVEEACQRVGMSATAAYALRRRVDAQSFRMAWDVALDYAIRRLSDAAFARALHGTTTPIFFQGEQIGERRRFDERLTMYMLTYRDPARYGKWRDKYVVEQPTDAPAITLAKLVDRVAEEAYAEEAGEPRAKRKPMLLSRIQSPQEVAAAAEADAQRRLDAEEAREDARRVAAAEAEDAREDRELAKAARRGRRAAARIQARAAASGGRAGGKPGNKIGDKTGGT